MHLCMCRELWKAIVNCFIVAISKKMSGTRKRSGTRVEKIVSFHCLASSTVKMSSLWEWLMNQSCTETMSYPKEGDSKNYAYIRSSESKSLFAQLCASLGSISLYS